METIKVNMNPNPLDVQTIHASQNDTEARQWEFELHNNGELIDTSDVKEQLVFKAYKGGTEQLLPENGSVPTTAPFLGDIRYPQGLLTDQQFTYRQSPTEEDGLANVVGIKGQTLKWNQLASVVGEQTVETGLFNADIYIYSGHKYLVSVEGTQLSGNLFFNIFYNDGTNKSYQSVATSSGRHTFIFNCVYTAHGGSANIQGNFWFYAYNVSSWKNLMLFDLTAMGLNSLTDAEILQWFADYFPLSYYSYNQGSLLSFMGNGIKTVGKNLLPPSESLSAVPDITISADNGVYTLNGTPSAYRQAIATDSFVLESGTYHFSIKFDTVNNGVSAQLWSVDGLTTYASAYNESGVEFTLSERAELKFRITVQVFAGTLNNYIIRPMLEFGSVAADFEPYTETTTDLPISTYFPTGMKSAGTVYDELTPTKAITRIGAVDLGSLAWNGWEDNGSYIFYASITGKKVGRTNPCICPLYEYNKNVSVWTDLKDKQITGNPSNSAVYVRDSSYTDANTFKTAMSGVYLYYELSTPTETSFTTASLVTENAEIPLSNEDGVLIGKCTEQLSENPGFIDAKIKLTDSDGTCYSNKLQLHVERSPQ